MRYIVAPLNKARNWGFQEAGHLVKGDFICLNEKEVVNNEAMAGSLEERAEILAGAVYSLTEAKMIMMNI